MEQEVKNVPALSKWQKKDLKRKNRVRIYEPSKIPTEKQRKFAELYLSNGKDKIAAYMGSHNVRSQIPTRTHKAAAERLLQHPKVMKLLAEGEARKHEVTKKVFEKYAITEERILEELARLAFSNPTDVMEWDEEKGITTKPSSEIPDDVKAAITEITETELKDGRKKVKVKMASKKDALEALAKHKGLMKEQLEHKHLVAAKLIIES